MIIAILLISNASAKGDFNLVVNRGIEQESFRLMPKGKAWECGTKTAVMTETPGDPMKNLNWPALEKEAHSRPKNCKETVKITDDLDGKDKILSTCLSQPVTKALYERISGNCKVDIE